MVLTCEEEGWNVYRKKNGKDGDAGDKSGERLKKRYMEAMRECDWEMKWKMGRMALTGEGWFTMATVKGEAEIDCVGNIL